MNHDTFPIPDLETEEGPRPVNVSSVPQRSLFRYPGGKTWLVPKIRQWLSSKETHPRALIEPFAGGGIVGLTAAAENLVDRVLMVELDQQVASVWTTVLSDDYEWLIDRIGEFVPTPHSVRELLSDSKGETRELAFKTIVRNRTSHGGVLAPGGGFIKQGENNKGIASRWYSKTLQKRILAIHQLKDKIEFIHGDGLEVMQSFMSDESAVLFVDPPYTAPGKMAGSRLYTHWDVDHEEIFRIASYGKADMLLTYDNEPGSKHLAKKYDLQTNEIAMQNTHLAKMKELLISRNLDWNK